MATEGPCPYHTLSYTPTDHIELWLRLNSLELAPHRLHAMLEVYDGDLEALFADTLTGWRERLPLLNDKRREKLAEAKARDIGKDSSALAKSGAALVTVADDHYPANLRTLPDAPPVLLVRGTLVPEDKFSVAIVGSRRATNYGLTLARQFGRELTARGFSVVSGGALGVDTAAHHGALEGRGRTVAYLGCGVDICYPPANRDLFREIAEGRGAVVSEFPMGTKPEPWRFPARNRLISGATLGTLVIESPADSGSMITARIAGEQNREVFAIPGPVGMGHNSGCHKLIQEGAKLVETVDDILTELGVLTLDAPEERPAVSAPTPPLPPEQRCVLDLLTLQPRQLEGMIGESGLAAPQVMGILTLLEMRGLAKRLPGNTFVRVL